MRSDNGQRRRFRYERRDPKLIETRANQSLSRFAQLIPDKYPKFKVKEKLNTLRILPPTWEGNDHYAYNVLIHYGVGPDNSSFFCLKMLKKPCAICDERVSLVRQGEANLAKRIRPQERRLCWVIDRDKESEGPQVWNYGKSLDQEFSGLALDPDTKDVLYIDDPDEGYDISFRCTNAGKVTAEYTAKRILPRPKPLSDNPKRQDEWLDYVQRYPVPTLLTFYSYKEMLDALGSSSGSSEEEDVDLGPIRRRSLRDEEPEERTRDEDEIYDQETGEVEEDQVEYGDVSSYIDDGPPPEEADRRQRAATSNEDVKHRRVIEDEDDRPVRPRLRQTEDPELTRGVNPSRQARDNLRQLRPPGQRPSQRER